MTISADDLRFLVELRDYLNSAASPATGATIAFSTFVSDQAAGHRLSDARVAYPGYERLARRLRVFIKALSCFAIAVTVFVAVLAAYVYWGNSIVSGAASIAIQTAALDTDIAREEAAGLSELRRPESRLATTADDVSDPPDSGRFKELVPLCSAVASIQINNQPTKVYRSAQHEQLCARSKELEDHQYIINQEVGNWGSHLRWLLGQGSQQVETAPFDLSIINGYVIPIFMGALGAAAFVLRGFLKSLGDRVLTTRDIQSNQVRLVLGTLSGLAIGFFLSSPSSGTTTTNTFGMGINLTTPALSFLAGYAVEVLFKFLDTLAGQAFSTKP